MRSIISLLAAVALATVPAFAAPASMSHDRAAARLEKALEGRVAGRPVDCINLRSIQSTQIIDRTAILYKVGSKLYLNRPESGSSALRRDDILVTKTWGSQLCSIDTVHLLDSGGRFPRGFVGLGKFIPYSKAEPRG